MSAIEVEVFADKHALFDEAQWDMGEELMSPEARIGRQFLQDVGQLTGDVLAKTIGHPPVDTEHISTRLVKNTTPVTMHDDQVLPISVRVNVPWSQEIQEYLNAFCQELCFSLSGWFSGKIGLGTEYPKVAAEVCFRHGMQCTFDRKQACIEWKSAGNFDWPRDSMSLESTLGIDGYRE